MDVFRYCEIHLSFASAMDFLATRDTSLMGAATLAGFLHGLSARLPIAWGHLVRYAIGG